jgi:hypothetical protein
VATLCAALVQEFEVEQTQCEEDVLAFLIEAWIAQHHPQFAP